MDRGRTHSSLTPNHPNPIPLISGLYTLLSSALSRRPTATSGPTPPPGPSGWNEIHAQARRQTVTALVFNAVCGLPESQLPPDPLLMQWLAESETIRSRSRAMDKAVSTLLDRLSGAGVTAVLLKGQAMAAMYPDPEARQCGDIDLFIPPGHAHIGRILEVAAPSGAARHADGSISFVWQGFTVELHPRMLDIHSRRSMRRLSAFPELETLSGSTLPDGSQATVPSPQATLLMLSAHIFKHAAGRGIGLRQLCDMTVAMRTHAPLIRSGEMDAIFRAAGLSRWNRMLFSFLSLRLGLGPEALPVGFTPSRRLAGRLEKIIIEGGNFGHHASGIAARRGPAATLLAFLRRARFALATAPRETAALLLTLAKGRLSKNRLSK